MPESAGVSLSVLAPGPRPWSDLILEMMDQRRGIVLGFIAAAYLLGLTSSWRIEPDSGLYLTLGRNLALGRGYTFRGVQQQLAYPGLPNALSAVIRIFGENSIFAANVLIVLCAGTALWLTFRLVCLAYDRPTAVVITTGVAFTHLFFRYSCEILTDIPFLMGAMAVLTGHEALFGDRKDGGRPRWWDWVVLCSGLGVAVTTRPTMIPLLAAWILALAWSAIRGRNWKAALAGLGMCIIGIILFLIFDPRRTSGHGPGGVYERYAFDQLTVDVGDHLRTTGLANVKDLFGKTIARSIFGMPLGTWWLNAIFGMVAIVGGLMLFRQRAFWGLWILFTLLMMTLTISLDRYFLQILPLMVLGWWNVLRWVNRLRPAFTGNLVFVLLLVAGMALNCIQVGAIILQQRSRPYYDAYADGKYAPFVTMSKQIPKLTAAEDIILCPVKLSRAMTFLTDRYAYETNEPLPTNATRFFVAFDPADGLFVHWLLNNNIVMEGNPIISVPRLRKQPPIYLIRAHRKMSPG